MGNDIWTWMHVTGDTLDDSTGGLIAEARRLADQVGGRVGVVAMGACECPVLAQLGGFGAEQVLHVKHMHLAAYHGELFAETLAGLIEERRPRLVLFAHTPPAADLIARLAAALETAAATRAIDLSFDDTGALKAVRPIANGYLFESVALNSPAAALVSLLPAVLADPQPAPGPAIPVDAIAPPIDPEALKTHTVKIVEADPRTLDIEDADLVVAGGRGVGKGEAFEIIHRLAATLGGSVAGTRPVIDWHTLPFERQIGQTGKTVSPRLIINCGISGANEYTAGIEKSQLVIAINTDARARIFRFADLCIVGDLHTVLPLLVERLEQTAK